MLLRQLGKVQGRVELPDKRESVLIQSAGREWRFFHEVVLNVFGVCAIFGTLALLGVFYFFRGPIRIQAGRSGFTILRFDAIERFVHWLAGVTFVILGLTGLNFTYGKKVLLPLIGPNAFSAFTEACKYAHNFLSFPFVLGVVGMLLLWGKGQFADSCGHSMAQGGWRLHRVERTASVAIQCRAEAAVLGRRVRDNTSRSPRHTLIFPFYVTGIGGMQVADIIHSLGAMLFIAAIIAHIYIATLGMEGGFDAMANGMPAQ